MKVGQLRPGAGCFRELCTSRTCHGQAADANPHPGGDVRRRGGAFPEIARSTEIGQADTRNSAYQGRTLLEATPRWHYFTILTVSGFVNMGLSGNRSETG